MVERLGSAVLELSTDDAKFTKGVKGAKTAAGKLDKNLGKAEKSSRKLGTSLAKVGTRVKGLAKSLISMRSAVVLAAGAVGFGLLVKRALKTADVIGKVADKVGLTTDSLQELRFAAQLANVNQTTLDMAMQRFSRRVGEAAQGSGELKDTLIALNIEVLKADGTARGLDDVLGDLANSLRDAKSDQERLRIAFKAFDSEGAALVVLFKDGADGIERMREEARKFGAIIPESIIRSASEANDQLMRLTATMKAQATVILATLSPQIIALGNTFLSFAPSIKAFIDAFLPEEFADVDELIRRIDTLIELRREMTMGGDRAALEALSQRELNRRAREVLAIDKQIIALGRLIGERRKMRLEEENVLPPPAALVGPLPPDVKEFERAMKKRISLEQRAQQVIAVTRTAQEEFNEVMVQLGELLALRKIDWETYSRAVDMAQETLKEALDTGVDVFKKLEEAGETAFDNLSDALIEFGATGKFEWRDLARVALTAIRDIVAAYTNKGNFGSLFATLVSGFFGGGSSVVPRGPGGRRHGGNIAAGQLAMVGEGGRELFRPSVAGSILSNRDTERAISGGGDTYIIDATGADREGMRQLTAMITALDGSIEPRSVAAVVAQSRRQPRMIG